MGDLMTHFYRTEERHVWARAQNIAILKAPTNSIDISVSKLCNAVRAHTRVGIRVHFGVVRATDSASRESSEGPKEWGVVGNNWFDRILLSTLCMFKTPHVDRCSNPLPWDPLSSPYIVNVPTRWCMTFSRRVWFPANLVILGGTTCLTLPV